MPNNRNHTSLLDLRAHLSVISSKIEISNPKNLSTQYKKEEKTSALANTIKFGTRESFTKIRRQKKIIDSESKKTVHSK